MIVVLGHFASGTAKIDGQIYRSRLVVQELTALLGAARVATVDTGRMTSRPISTLRAIWRASRDASDLIIMPGLRGLKWLLPVYGFLKRLKGVRIHYFVVGGWLPSRVRDRTIPLRRLKWCDGVYVQTSRMRQQLLEDGLENVVLMPNFRRFSLERDVSLGVASPLRLVFFSRILPDKGPHLIAQVVDKINADAGERIVFLDLYGPVQAGFHDWFSAIMGNASNAVTYKGVLAPECIATTLVHYDALVLPTSYSGEGFPGVFLDAMISGLPVIASNWQDNGEVIRHELNGLLFESGDQADLERQVRRLLEEPTLVQKMKGASAKLAANYHVDKVLPPVLKNMGIAIPDAGPIG